MRFTPKSDKEIAEENLLPKGEYDYEVMEALDKHSKSGNEMIELKLRFFHGEQGTRVFKDYLLEAMAGKLKHFCDSHGLQREYENGTVCASDCEGKSGRAVVGIKKDKTGQFPDANTVFDYVAPKAIVSSPRGSVTNGPQPVPFIVSDDDVPF